MAVFLETQSNERSAKIFARMATAIATASNKLNETYTNGSIYVRSGLICLSDNIEMSIVTCAANLFWFHVPKMVQKIYHSAVVK